MASVPWRGSEGEAERLSNISDCDFKIEAGKRPPLRMLKRGGAAAAPPRLQKGISRNNNILSALKIEYAVERETADSWGPAAHIGPIDYAQSLGLLKILGGCREGLKCRMWRAFFNAGGFYCAGMRIGSS